MAEQYPTQPSELMERIRAGALEASRMGMAPDKACGSEGVPARTYRTWREAARRGVPEYVEFFEQLAAARDEGERADVKATVQAAQPKRVTTQCGQCCAPVEVDLTQLEAWHKSQVAAAGVALERLGRRNPRDWAPSSRVSIQAEHEALLELAEEVLEPAQFQKLLAAYVESTGGVVPVQEPSEPDAPLQH